VAEHTAEVVEQLGVELTVTEARVDATVRDGLQDHAAFDPSWRS
jgi:hypothetical protein